MRRSNVVEHLARTVWPVCQELTQVVAFLEGVHLVVISIVITLGVRFQTVRVNLKEERPPLTTDPLRRFLS